VSVTRSGDNLILNMPGNVTFKTASADLNSNFYKVLDSVALVLKEFDKTLIDVEGHTDSDGSDEYNQQLSMQRATSVGAYLQSHGVNSQRVVGAGRGRNPPDRKQRYARGQAAEPPGGAQAPAHRSRLIEGNEGGGLRSAALFFSGFHS
jgi:outer membrane protein OmpA-like peptidoglycan-associated protein